MIVPRIFEAFPDVRASVSCIEDLPMDVVMRPVWDSATIATVRNSFVFRVCDYQEHAYLLQSHTDCVAYVASP